MRYCHYIILLFMLEMAQVRKFQKRIKKILGISSLFLSLSLSFSLHASDDTKASGPLEKIESLGLEVLGGEVPIDFTLEDLDGTKRSLSDYKGQWIWLVFWATWCSVCKKEMPTLESLFQEFKDKNLTILGVSVDREKNPLAKSIEKYSLTFPIVHDPTGKVASQYNAGGVPMIYLLSPDWKLVGLARGALNWERRDVLAKVEDLIKVEKISDTKGEGQSTENLLPPTLKVILPPDSFSVGQWQSLEVIVKWPGPSHLYLIKVPRLEQLPEGVQRGGVSSSSESEGLHSVLKYHFPVLFKESGSFKVGPIDLSYRPRFSRLASYQTTRNPGTTVKVVNATFLPFNFASGLGLVLVVFVGGIAFFVWARIKRRKEKKNCREGETSRRGGIIADWAMAFRQAKKYKVEGDMRTYCLKLFSVCRNIRDLHPYVKGRGHDMGILNKMENLLEEIRYGGKLPQDSEILRMEKIVAWCINEESWQES